jgi:phage shock protein E
MKTTDLAQTESPSAPSATVASARSAKVPIARSAVVAGASRARPSQGASSSLKFLILLFAPLLANAEEIPNPAIDYAGFAKLTQELQPVRAAHRITEGQFLKMSAEPGTVVFDARTTDKFDQIHIKGARHLPFTDFTAEALAKVLPDKSVRILIYCNNNFLNEPVNFPSKAIRVSLNIQTFINLHAYGYTNIYELGPLLDVKTTKIPFEGKSVVPSTPTEK